MRSPLGRLTAQERENVRRELEEHVEDRMEALLEMGWSAELAEGTDVQLLLGLHVLQFADGNGPGRVEPDRQAVPSGPRLEIPLPGGEEAA